MVVLAVKQRATKCRIVPGGEIVLLRPVVNEVEGELITVRPNKIWRYRKMNNMTGKIVARRIDIPALGLTPLLLRDEEIWDPQEQYWAEEYQPLEPCFKPIIEYGKRSSFEMEQIIPFDNPEKCTDPIWEAADAHQAGDYETAYRLIEKVLIADLRCLDAHAHLGAWDLNQNDASGYTLDRARRHYEVGIGIGELSFPSGCNIVLPWIRIDNRPFLRCLHGYGLCLWRMGQFEQARQVFEKMLWLNPSDNQGARFLLDEVEARRPWHDTE